jgi:decaprenylphospho-beta-D-erythro-pentofuranosid-2-ulose 2-reductase
VVLSSVAGIRARKSNYVYGSAKAGLDAFAQGLGDALADGGGRVMVVRPGFVHTRMTAGMPSQPFATDADSVADAIVTGLQRNAEIVYAPALLQFVFGAMRLLPRSLWRVVSAR